MIYDKKFALVSFSTQKYPEQNVLKYVEQFNAYADQMKEFKKCYIQLCNKFFIPSMSRFLKSHLLFGFSRAFLFFQEKDTFSVQSRIQVSK